MRSTKKITAIITLSNRNSTIEKNWHLTTLIRVQWDKAFLQLQSQLSQKWTAGEQKNMLMIVMDDSRIRNQKSRFFPRIEKNRNLDFLTSLCIDFYRRGIHLYSIVITCRHFGKPEIVAVINNTITCITADSATVNRSHCTGRSKNYRPPSPTTREPHVIHDTIQVRSEGPWRETVTWYQPLHDTKTVGAVLGVGHQRQMTPHPSTSRKW